MLMTILGVIAIILIVFFISGAFESFIVKNCTSCGKKGNLTTICDLYSGMVKGEGLGSQHPFNLPLGVIHSHHLCKKCSDKLWTRMSKIF